MSLSSSMVGGLTSTSSTLPMGKLAPGISNNCCENSVTLLDNKLFKLTSVKLRVLHANNTLIPLIYVTIGVTYLSHQRCADWFFFLFLIFSK